MTTTAIPSVQSAVQLVGPDTLALNAAKPVHRPGARQILAKVECVGLCQSDMKLLHQFSGHARKTPVLKHVTADILAQIPSYVPDGAATVPGHEAVVRVVEVGAGVTSVAVGGRYLVQADFRDLKTAGSNGAFGYNFEGGLQQYVLLDERVTVAKDGTSYLIPVPNERGASQIALVEPWACIEDSFINRERTALKPSGTCLVVVAKGVTADLSGLDTVACATRLIHGATLPGFTAADPATLAPQSVDDLVFVGHDADLLDRCLPLLANGALVAIACAGGHFGRPVKLPVGRVHYGNLRFVGTPGNAPAQALARIPATAEVRQGDRVHVVGAAGPMGSMAVIRLCSLGRGLTVEAGDRSVPRLEVLRGKAAPVATARGVTLRLYDATTEKPAAAADYTVIMVPIAPLVSAAVTSSRPKGIINIFAGIPADVWEPIDLDAYIDHALYFIGTSGSTMEDMQVVLRKVLDDSLDTNLSVGAVCGIGGAITGLDAVKKNLVAGKILVYPDLGDFPLTELAELVVRFPSVGAAMRGGAWTREAELELLRVAAK
jgi:threonine dehydrogenase-like Zn-dependent dehydrogenase